MRLFLAALTLLVATTPATAQWLDRKTPGIPRTADGKPNLTAPAPKGPDGKPDLSGVWSGANVVARPEPTELQSWVVDLAHQYQQDYFKTRPMYQCLPSGPEAERYGGWKRILQTPAAIAILNDDLTYRVIFTDGRTLEDNPAPSWQGYSVGRWEGDTFVVSSAGFNDNAWLDNFGHPGTESLKVTERWRRKDFGHLEVQVTIDDPKAYTKPWGNTVSATLIPDGDLMEFICLENEKDTKRK
jgi:hypothetical protein